jgi:capsular exopolysaccharide synthesis family protein
VNKFGLANYLLETANLDEIIQRTKFNSLNVITGGQVINEPELLLDSSRMKALIPILLSNYDMVLLDAPAVLAVADASVLAPLVDGVLLVARLRLIRKENLVAALEQLDNVKAKMIGLVINGDESSSYYSYYNRRTTPVKWKKNKR